MSIAARMMGWLVARRRQLPGFVNRLIDDVAKNPDGPAARLADVLLGGRSSRNAPPPTSVPDTPIRVYIGPTNYAAQGYLWARALEASRPDIGARNMEVVLPGGFGFPADSRVPVSVYNRGAVWQKAQAEAIARFTHVLIEAERPLLGSLFHRDVAAEIAELRSRGLSVAFMAHGTDVRSPREHIARTPWSPFHDDPEHTAVVQAEVDRSLRLIDEHPDLPVFVSTPDLLLDVPRGIWCPVVVDAPRWTSDRPVLERPVPVVVHVPSMGGVKGTQLIEPALRRLHEEGLVEYRPLSGVPASEMPGTVAEADIVLDQFRIGSYGVAACEAMAAGRLVVGAVPIDVRELVERVTGRALPILEAQPDSIEQVLRDVLADRGPGRALAEAGPGFVAEVHAGALSAEALTVRWIDAR